MAILESFLSLKFWKDSRQNSATTTVHFGIVTTVPTVALLALLLLSSLVTGLIFLVSLPKQRWSPPLRLQVSHCSTFRSMCDVPSIIIIIIIKIVNDTVLKGPSAFTYLASIFTISGRCKEVLHRTEQCEIPGFRRGVNEPCSRLGIYAA